MNIKIAIIFAVISVIGVSSFASAKDLVGGKCSYEEFQGVCEKEKNDTGTFLFKGVVDDKKVVLKNNKIGQSSTLKDKSECSLQFIKSGTCTPCLFSIGECGKDAWELFRNSAK